MIKMNRVDETELIILNDTGDIDLATNIGEFLRCAISEGYFEESKLESLVIIKQVEQD